ncbi:MAG: 30S ribosomal protein S15 [Candidatus Nanosyncoccaceae bacterium]|jgi:small subunit ribosomal protein S15
MITSEKKKQEMAKTQRNAKDVGSPEAQIAVLTARINEVIEHLKANKQDEKARRGLIQMVGKRKKLLSYLEKKDYDAYKATITKLGLRK